MQPLKAPFPYFGGKSSVAPVVWAALGQPKHYIEPFFGSGAVLLNRPDYNPGKHMETVCDKDGHLANVWRALQLDPDAVAKVCDYPVNHADLMARRRVMIANQDRLLDNLVKDDEWYDAKLAGYWVWAASCWIGSGLTRPNAIPDITNKKGVHKQSLTGKRPHTAHGGHGVHSQSGGRYNIGQIPSVRDDKGINNQIPLLNHETGVCRRPDLCSHGVHKISIAEDPNPILDVRDPYTPGLWSWFRQLSERLRRVRVVCGDWTRVCGGDWQDDRGTCGIFYDPPYGEAANRDKEIYQEDSLEVAAAVREWCRERAERKTYRIVLAGYYEEHESLLNDGWTVHRWSAHGGFANKGKGKGPGSVNRHREALFFSPHCHSSGLRRFESAGILEKVPA